ncbi:hypothetical protein HPB49_026416 [Dermacentor silvarum]|nr:hypothetical protein HPB49_026416 [Dermacentor silvarum]
MAADQANAPSSAPRLRFSKSDDLDLLRDVRDCNPFEDMMRYPMRWTEIAVRLSAARGKVFSARTAHDRTDLLLTQYADKDSKSLRRSGTEEEYEEQDKLLQELLDMARENRYRYRRMRKTCGKQSCSGVETARLSKLLACRSRDAAAAAYAVTSSSSNSSGTNLGTDNATPSLLFNHMITGKGDTAIVLDEQQQQVPIPAPTICEELSDVAASPSSSSPAASGKQQQQYTTEPTHHHLEDHLEYLRPPRRLRAQAPTSPSSDHRSDRRKRHLVCFDHGRERRERRPVTCFDHSDERRRRALSKFTADTVSLSVCLLTRQLTVPYLTIFLTSCCVCARERTARMPGCCCAPNCKSNYAGELSVRVHVFPKDPVRRASWTRAVSRNDFAPTKNTVVRYGL